MKIIIWGTGGTVRNFLDQKVFLAGHEIVAFTSNQEAEWGRIFKNGIFVVSPGKLKQIEFDRIVICSLYRNEIQKQLVQDIGISEDRIFSYLDMQNELCEKLIRKYQDTSDADIQRVLDYYKEHGFNIYGYYHGKTGEKFLVEREDGLPFIWLEGKKMYFPATYQFRRENGKEYIYDILQEQKSGSPHLYVRSQDDIKKGSVVVDAGVCEGNFALRYIEKAKKVYLIESDEKWIDALQRTFYHWKDKVVLCNKYLGKYDSGDTITLDKLVGNEKIDFLKMDIEGAETDALLGGAKVLRASRAKCAVCSYHKQGDEEHIKQILHEYGYRTSTSEGYMFFPYDDHMVHTLDFRRGIVYGDK